MRGNALDLDVLALRLGQRPRVVLEIVGAKTTHTHNRRHRGVKTKVRTFREAA